ncbi:MAG: tetratricopeptide repeat protein [Isosphaeraceae bacterium]|nr:tetratricopeptide repeat protein [Isosphaeraceae bacterium]
MTTNAAPDLPAGPLSTSSGSRRLRIALMILATLPAIGVPAAFVIRSQLRTQEWRRSLSEAESAVYSKEFTNSTAALESLERLRPSSPEAEYLRAVVEVRRDRPEPAMDAMRRALERGYPEPPLLVLRAVLMARADRYAESEPLLAEAFREEAEPRAEIAEALSRCYLRTFQPARLQAPLARWMELSPDDPRPYLWRVELNQRLATEVDPLIRDYREALRRDPTLEDARLALADRLREASKIDEAGEHYAEVIARYPRNASARIGAARVAMLQGDPPRAVEHLEAAIEAEPKSSVALRELGLIDLRYNRFEKACERLKLAVELEPHDPEVRFSYVRALSAAGRKAEAAAENATTERLRAEQQEISNLREKLAERPNDLDLRSKVARYLIEHGHAKEGLEWTTLILASDPKHAETCRLLAEYHAKNGNPALANYYKLMIPRGK